MVFKILFPVLEKRQQLGKIGRHTVLEHVCFLGSQWRRQASEFGGI